MTVCPQLVPLLNVAIPVSLIMLGVAIVQCIREVRLAIRIVRERRLAAIGGEITPADPVSEAEAAAARAWATWRAEESAEEIAPARPLP